METMSELSHPQRILLFNSPLETGIRALIILNSTYPNTFDLLQLTWFDHLVVHTGDIGGPVSLHPGVPSRSGELLVRRRLIEESLTLMRRLHLINISASDLGFIYQASDDAPSFLEHMHSKYLLDLKERALWLAENVCNLSIMKIEELVANKIGRWNIEFQSGSRARKNKL